MRSLLKKMLGEPAKIGFYGYFYLAGALARRRFGARPIRVIDGPVSRPYLAWKVFRLAGLRPVTSDAALALAHEDATFVAAQSGAINGRCVDISKSRITQAFAETFGYPLTVDPRTYAGPMACKSEENAAHDGATVMGPVTEPLPGAVYQRLIDNRQPDGTVLDIRPCIAGAEIAFCYLKYRPFENRYSNHNSRVEAVPTEQALSAEEVANVIRFCQAIGLDLGEIDVLRDGSDGRIYIVDVAKTPHSPGDRFIGVEGIRCMHKAAAAFRRQFL